MVNSNSNAEENLFINQSSYNDENESGGAKPEDTGGASEASAGTSEVNAPSIEEVGGATSAVAENANSIKSKSFLNDTMEKLKAKIAELPNPSLFSDGKFIFPDNLLKNLKLDNLKDLIAENMKKGMSKSEALKSALNKIMQDQLESIKNSANESWVELQKIGGKFLDNMKDKFQGFLLSRIYVPDTVFLAGLTPIALATGGKNLAYKNNYIRKLCFNHDMPLTLRFCDSLQKVKYRIDNNKWYTNANNAAKKGSIGVAFYILGEVNKDYKEYKNSYPFPKDYDSKNQEKLYKNYTNQIKENEDALKRTDDPVMKAKYQAKIKSLEELKGKLFYTRELEYKSDPMYPKITKMVEDTKKKIIQTFRNIIVYSYSNLDPIKLKLEMDKFDLDPCVFGSNDKKYGKTGFISESHLNIMAPFYTPPERKSLGTQVTRFTQRNSLVPDVKDIKYISPRNVHVKANYIILASKTMNSKTKFMSNEPYYERMKYPVYSSTLSSLDEAAKDFLKVGLGRDIINLLNTMEEAAYVYGKSLEQYLYNPSKVQYISYNLLAKLPTPDDDSSNSSSSSSGSDKGNSGSSSSGSNDKPNTGRPDNPNSENKGNPNKGATGPTVPSVLDPTGSVIDAMNGQELNNFLISNSNMSSDEIMQLDEDTKREMAKQIAKDKNIDPKTLLNSLSKDSLITYLKNNGTKFTDNQLNNMDLSTLKNNCTKTLDNYLLDLNPKIHKYMTYESMTKYLRKHYNYTTLELSKKTLAWVRNTFEDKLKEEFRNICYPLGIDKNFSMYDAEGFPIIGYPSDAVIKEAIDSGKIGYPTRDNANGYPVTTTGKICPIIGYNASNKAMYGTPLFYPDLNPIGSDIHNTPVFCFCKDKSVFDEQNTTELEIKEKMRENNNKIESMNKEMSKVSSLESSIYTSQIKALKEINAKYQNIIDLATIKPVIGYDEFGNRVYTESGPYFNITTPDGVKCLGYDISGKPIYEINEKGKFVIGYDRNLNPVFGRGKIEPVGKDDKNRIIYRYTVSGQPIYGFTSEGYPVSYIEYNSDGTVKTYSIIDSSDMRKVIGKTEDGKDIYGYDERGLPILGFDKNGKPIVSFGISKENCKSRIDKIKEDIKNLTISGASYLIEYLTGNKESINTEAEAIKYVQDLGLKNAYNEYLNDKVVDKDVFVIDGNILSRYIIEIEKLENELNVYNRLYSEIPSPPIIGYDSNGIPILGVSLIKETLENYIPKLEYSNKSGSNFGMSVSNNSSKSNNSSVTESVLDKNDLDIDKDFIKAERELMLMSNNKLSGQILNIMYIEKNE